ncbi:MAG: hypothetical protein ACR2KG_03175 [Nocardioidaceae bacterium]
MEGISRAWTPPVLDCQLAVLSTGFALVGPNSRAGSAVNTQAQPATGNDVVGAIPPAWTPWINDGQVHAVTQVGNTMVVGGTFTNVSPSGGGSTLTPNYIVAFDATTGQISTAFAPQLNGSVEALQPGNDPTGQHRTQPTAVDGSTAIRFFDARVEKSGCRAELTPRPGDEQVRRGRTPARPPVRLDGRWPVRRCRAAVRRPEFWRQVDAFGQALLDSRAWPLGERARLLRHSDPGASGRHLAASGAVRQ